MARVRRTHNLRAKFQGIEAGYADGLTKGGLLVKQAAQKNAPVLTGRMMRSVTVSRPFRHGQRIVVRVGSRVDYAYLTEKEPYISKRKLGRISVAKGAKMPWLKPALKDQRAAAIAVIKASIRQSLRRAKAV